MHLWLETAVADSLSWWFYHDDYVVHRPERAGDVAGLRRGNLRRLLADEARLLTSNLVRRKLNTPSPWIGHDISIPIKKPGRH